VQAEHPLIVVEQVFGRRRSCPLALESCDNFVLEAEMPFVFLNATEDHVQIGTWDQHPVLVADAGRPFDR
jgi:hypothetical protein